jgi:hypothetical protein
MADVSHIIGAIERYVEHGIPTGSCTEAILSNDLFDAFGRADEDTREGMFQIVQHIYSNTPRGCWGSREAYSDWIKQGGLARTKEAANG